MNQFSFDKALKTGEAVDVNKWSLRKISPIFYSSDDLLKTKQKLKESQLMSNLESEDECEIGCGNSKKLSTRRFSSSDESEQFDHRRSVRQRPPPIKSPIYQSKLQEQETISRDSTQLDDTVQELHSISRSPSAAGSFSSCSAYSVSTPQSTGLCTSTYNIERLVSLVATVKEQNDQILQWITTQENQNVQNVISLPVVPFTFPLSTVEEVEGFSDYLQLHNDMFIAFTTYLATLSGSNVTGRTNRILKFLLADPVAAKFNFYGKRSCKRAFYQLRIRNLTVDAVKSSDIPNSTEKDVENAIKMWLKHASDRMRLIRLCNGAK